ncbi:ubiquinol-cytochrome C reductase [Aaosphaeria arxii CBS 175.79]|uniref:Complex III subunit 9 n=1 Tax=Aaosphaeria arxii CBS 175.79 TaxID=1450172 RepID=A0A6A5XGL9_9PLEO|nr:ubiquinol-cytochrome C reductase [Aaosphaeria arxii CBS 175.79]KAF2012385.1 ubiquinol-cytochrome C reductase [Aaosphaeria arxii CBS 175.79]
MAGHLQASFLSYADNLDGTILTVNRSVFLRRNTTMLGTVFFSAFALQLAFDTGSDKIWDSVNKGRQWKDIKQRYMEQSDEE